MNSHCGPPKRLAQTGQETPGTAGRKPDFDHVHPEPGTWRNPLPGPLPPPHSRCRSPDPTAFVAVYPLCRGSKATPAGLDLNDSEGVPFPRHDVQFGIASASARAIVPRHHPVAGAAKHTGGNPLAAGSESQVRCAPPKTPGRKLPAGNCPPDHGAAFRLQSSCRRQMVPDGESSRRIPRAANSSRI